MAKTYTEIKTEIANDITSKTAKKSITKTAVGGAIGDVLDFSKCINESVDGILYNGDVTTNDAITISATDGDEITLIASNIINGGLTNISFAFYDASGNRLAIEGETNTYFKLTEGISKTVKIPSGTAKFAKLWSGTCTLVVYSYTYVNKSIFENKNSISHLNEVVGDIVKGDFTYSSGNHSSNTDRISIRVKGGDTMYFLVNKTNNASSWYKVMFYRSANDTTILYETSVIIFGNETKIEIPDNINASSLGIYFSTTGIGNAQYVISNVPSKSIIEMVRKNVDDIADIEEEINDAASQMNTASRVSTTKKNDPLVLLHFSDIHGDAVRLKRLIDKSKGYQINDILFTGDAINTSYDVDNMNYWTDNGAENVLMCIGNHDTADTNGGGSSSSPSTWTWNAHAGAEAFGRYMSNMNNWGVTHDGDTSHCYYYKDYTDNNVRLIVLDCMAYDDAQNTWLQSTLSSAGNKAVIIASHYLPYVITNNGCAFDCGIGSTDAPLDSRAKELVDTFQTSGGKFVCWLCGHTHSDRFGCVTGYPNQAVVVVAEARCFQSNYQYNDIERVDGTRSQDLFNLISINTYDGTFSLLRIGSNYNKNLRRRKTMCWNYVTHSLVCQE